MLNRNTSLRQAENLTQSVKVAQESKANVLGSEVYMGMFLGKVPKLPAITYFLDNSGGGALATYIIGDPTRMVAVAVGGVITDPATVQGSAAKVLPNKNFFYQVGIIYSSINYQTSSTPNQFANRFEQYIVNSAGNSTNETINMASARRNTADDPLLLTITGQYMLDIHRGIVVDVLAGESVTITLVPSAYTI